MAASDDEDTLASFGTPFEPLEEDAPRKKAIPIHEQVVTDAEGRRRFHGAFTGGFSAGYFNTVGTKEGWQPSTFVSSRSKKGEQRQQRPEDFMDDDDMGEFGIAPKRIATKEEFLSQGSELQNRRKRMVNSDVSEGVIPGAPPLQDLVVPVKMSVGVELLRKMGWKEGQGVGPRERRTRKKIYGCSLPPASSSSQTAGNDEEEDIFAVGLLFAPKDIDVFTFTLKDDKHGLGYKGLDPSTALFGRDNWLGIDPVSRRVGQKGISGEAFGIGAFEEADDNIYAIDHLSNYDNELGGDTSTGLHGWTGPPKENSRGGALSIFTNKPKAIDAMKTFPPPVVPRSFDCTHKFDASITGQKSSEEVSHKKKALTATDRGEMLGEEPLPAPQKSVFEYVSEEDKKRVLSASKGVISKPSSKTLSSRASSTARDSIQKSSSSTRWTWAGHSSFKPFLKDPAKQARYEEFLKLRQGEQVSPQVRESGLTEWEREREKEEFARSASLYRPMNSTMAARFTTAKHPDDHRVVYEDVPAQESSESSEQVQAASMKMFGKLTRDNFEWHPENTLCKRFNIPNPYPGSRIAGVPKVRRPKFTLGDFIVPQEPRAITSEHSSTSSDNDGKSGELGRTTETVSVIDSKPNPSDSKSVGSEVHTKTVVTSSLITTVSNLNVPQARELKDTAKGTQNEENPVAKRPDMDLFKAIFADSSSEESEASSSEDEVGKEKEEIEGASIRASVNKLSEQASNSHVDESTEEKNLASRFVSGNKTVDEEFPSRPVEKEERRPFEMQIVAAKNTEKEKMDSYPENFGPALPPSFRKTIMTSNSCSREKHDVDTAQYKEDSDRKRRKDKETKKRYSDSSDSEEEYRSKHKHKHKEKKKHKHKHKSKHRYEEKERLGKKTKGKDASSKPLEQTHSSDDKQIVNKLKKLQNLKAGKRMRAADFM